MVTRGGSGMVWLGGRPRVGEVFGCCHAVRLCDCNELMGSPGGPGGRAALAGGANRPALQPTGRSGDDETWTGHPNGLARGMWSASREPMAATCQVGGAVGRQEG